MTQERHGRNIARTIRFQQVTHTSFRSGCQENAMLFTACAIWMWCRWAKKKHEKKNIYSERASPQPSHQDWMRWTEISAAMPPWWRGRICFAHSLANSPWIEIQKGAYNNLAALNQDWPKQMAHDMVYWYWLLIWIWCSYIYIDIVHCISPTQAQWLTMTWWLIITPDRLF